MASLLETVKLRSLLLQLVNSKVELLTNFSLVTGEVVQIEIFDVPFDYVILKESDNSFVYIPLFAIDSLIIVQEEGDL
ncbi:hypothetical protein H7K13_02485 [Priestia aryabhattai]|uniref:hypothetical protein n=1 Tax=Priestia TaxID=2800373 RepID=UPI001C8E81CB|nr:hypothetical protein [Priestia aryabhattai]MBY0073790.1 hypothetical protein [Priestia aryabhattai]MCL9637467.1 hypothetical protein [Bacillus zanthoxyli]